MFSISEVMMLVNIRLIVWLCCFGVIMVIVRVIVIIMMIEVLVVISSWFVSNRVKFGVVVLVRLVLMNISSVLVSRWWCLILVLR